MSIKEKKIAIMCIVSCLFIGYLCAKMALYTFDKNKTEQYSKTLLTRTILVIKQIDEIYADAVRISPSQPCSADYLSSIRALLWSKSLLKDIAYIDGKSMRCSALWGTFSPPENITHTPADIIYRGGTWYLDKAINQEFKASIYAKGNLAITVSPFLFNRFTSDPENKSVSAIVGNYDHSQHIFFIGNETAAVYHTEHGGERYKKYALSRACSREYDLCVVSGMSPQGIKDIPWAIKAAALMLSTLIGILLSISINLYIRKKSSILTRLQYALRNDRFSIVYQPIVSLDRGETVGVEALIRWKDNELGIIPPDVFIPLAEKRGVINQISHYVVKKSINELHDVINNHKIYLSINVNSSDLFSKAFKDHLDTVSNKFNIPPRLIALELTERQTANLASLGEKIARFRAAGYQIALDDFGTGYSNLDWLSKLAVDKIKVDRTITESIGTDSINSALLNNIITLLSNMHSQVIFEGVEKAHQKRFLEQRIPQANVQGWYYAKPMSAGELKKYLSAASSPAASDPLP